MPPARTTPRGRPSREGARYGLYVALGLAAVVLSVAVLSFVYNTEGDQVELDASFCPVDAAAITGRNVLLLDIGKPVSDASAGLAAELLHRVTLGMPANAELQVFLVAANPLAPRIFVERLCKPYASADLAVATAKDRSGEVRDCDDLPAQLSRHIRNRATQFCERRDALRWRIDGIIAGDWPATVANAYLVEAIEDTRVALAQYANPSLYVFSDMLQHAEWYSHAERGPNQWSYDDFARTRERQTGLLSESPPYDPELAVTVYYVPRRGLTEHPRVAQAHQRFWRRYFADVGSLTFEQQPVHVAYQVQPFAGPARDDMSTSVAEIGHEEESAAREAGGRQEQRVPAAESAAAGDGGSADPATVEGSDAEPALGAEDRVAEPPAVAVADSDPPPPIADIEPEVAQDALVADGGPAADPSFVDAAAEPEQSVETAPPFVADRDPVDPPQRALGNAPLTDTAPATEPARPEQGATPLSDASGNPAAPFSDTPAVDAAEPVAPPPPSISPEPDLADPAANPETAADAARVFCPAELRPEFVGVDTYPLGGNTRGRRTNYGSADIVVAFTIDDNGETADDEVTIQLARSTVSVPRYTALFTRRAEQIVRGWSYSFAAQDDCERRQSLTVRLQFRYRG